MGIRITRGADISIRLEKIAERSNRALRRVHRDGAYALRDTAEAMAPFKTGELEGSIEVIETVETGNRKSFAVEASAPHAVYMHEQVYDLGPGSQQKQATSQFVVGRKYMDRAVAWLHQEWGFGRKLRAALRKGIK